MPAENFAYKIFFCKNAQSLSEASPCLLKILLTKFSSAKIVSHFVASPRGEGYNIAYLFPIIFCNSAINDEISLNERYTEA